MILKVVLYIGNATEESLCELACYIEGYSSIIITNKKNAALIEKSWSFEVRTKFIFASHDELEEVSLAFCLTHSNTISSYFLFGDDKVISEVKLQHLKQSPKSSLHDLLSNYQNWLTLFFDKNNISSDLQAKLKFCSSILFEAKQTELNLLLGKTNVSSQKIIEKADATAFELMAFDEFMSLNKHYENLNNKYNLEASLYFTDKSTQVRSYYLSSFTRAGKFVEVDSFPVAFKYLSVLLYLSGVEVSKTFNYTGAYILFFRSLEVYCEGLLISQGKAKIDNYFDSRTSTTFANCYQINKDGQYIRPMGFGLKWNLIKSSGYTSQVPLHLMQKMNLHKKLRNNCSLTHGDIFFTIDLLTEVKNTTFEIINCLESKFSQNTLNWKKLMDNMNQHFVYDLSPKLGEFLINQYQPSEKVLG